MRKVFGAGSMTGAKSKGTKINRIQVIRYRLCQVVTGSVLALYHMPVPERIEGEESILLLPQLMKKNGIHRVCIMTTEGMIRRRTLQPLLEKLEQKDISYAIYQEILPDPTIGCIEAAAACYRSENCEAILAVGGGSVMDCAKVAAARLARPSRTVQQMTGMFRIRRRLPAVYAVPTTAGTGSEVTVAAVITDEKSRCKYPVEDICLIPRAAVLDPVLTLGLPKNLTAATGMDALTHAVEAYTNLYGSRRSRRYAREAVELIMKNLLPAYRNGEDRIARAGMLRGSCYAGIAFTNAFVGYVHAIAHAVGGIYHIPHGLANAVILPIVLEAYSESVYESLAELADAANIQNLKNEAKHTEDMATICVVTPGAKAQEFICLIRRLNQEMDIPASLPEIKEADIPEIVHRAMREAHPSYPTPQIWGEARFTEVVRRVAGR